MTGVERAACGVSRDEADRAEKRAIDVARFSAEDRVLLERLRGGDDLAFGELFSRHADAVRRLAMGLAADRSEAEDLTAEAFFRVLQAIRRGSGPTDNVRGYLLIVARRVAWEWSLRKRDVPVSDEELTFRAGSNADTSGQSAERNLIARAFTSLPERWRNVLWKVEVEGERPAVVAINFGLSPNATAALARRARQGLRAAYLQAHLTAERGSTGCRSVLEKLGAYTAGSIRGSERRRISTHLGGCTSCTRMQDELRDVCSGLRAHAGSMLVPAGLAALATGKVAGGFAATIKGALVGFRFKVALAASSAAAAGVVGLTVGPQFFDGSPTAQGDFEGDRGVDLVITSSTPSSTSPSLSLPSGSMTTQLEADKSARKTPERPVGEQAVPVNTTQPTESVVPTDEMTLESAPGGEGVRYWETTVQRETVMADGTTEVRETTVVTEVRDDNQTLSYTTSQTMTALAVPVTTTAAGSGTSLPQPATMTIEGGSTVETTGHQSR